MTVRDIRRFPAVMRVDLRSMLHTSGHVHLPGQRAAGDYHRMRTHREDKTGERILEYGKSNEPAKPRADVDVVIDTEAIQHVVAGALNRSSDRTCRAITAPFNNIPEPGWLRSLADTQKSGL